MDTGYEGFDPLTSPIVIRNDRRRGKEGRKESERRDRKEVKGEIEGEENFRTDGNTKQKVSELNHLANGMVSNADLTICHDKEKEREEGEAKGRRERGDEYLR